MSRTIVIRAAALALAVCGAIGALAWWLVREPTAHAISPGPGSLTAGSSAEEQADWCVEQMSEPLEPGLDAIEDSAARAFTRAAAVRDCLARDPEVAGALARRLATATGAQRNAIAGALGTSRNQAATQALLALDLRDLDAGAKVAVAQAIASPTAEPDLAAQQCHALLLDPHPFVRRTAVWCGAVLMKSHPDVFRPIVLRLAGTDTDAVVRHRADEVAAACGWDP